VRRAARRILHLALEDKLEDWTVNPGRLPDTAELVCSVARERYPDLELPMHSRWRHFLLAGKDLWSDLTRGRSWDSAAVARAAFDLAITSVLLDAGAGPGWRYRDAATGMSAARSEGLALASLRWFERGGLSDDPSDPLRADAAVLCRIDELALGDAFQTHDGNLLLGVKGRARLLNRLGDAVQARPELFALEDRPRPGGLFDALALRAQRGSLEAADVLEVLLDGLGSIWPDRPHLDGICLGDCWPHPALKSEQPAGQFVPLHKLAQWLAYSLIETLQRSGVPVGGLDGLTGLAEYRNGGLFVDTGVLAPRDPTQLLRIHSVADPFVVGWRAATVALLDELAPPVADRLGLAKDERLLARVLEGGTWAAGRHIARKKRADGGPPFVIASDGTVF
jgi:hypothetical protein